MSWRFRVVLLFFIFLFIAVAGRLFYWQVIRADELARLGELQYGRRVLQSAQRGEIKTSDNFSIAANKVSYLVFANPKEIKNKETIISLLSPLLQEDTASISSLLSLDRYWVPLKRTVDHETKNEIEALKLKGIGFEEHYTRYYPEASTAAKLLGFVGKNEYGEDAGYFGLEGYYDRQLRGRGGGVVQIFDALGKPILAKMNNAGGKTDGRSLILHIDRTVQFIVERELKKSIEKYGAQGGMAAVTDPTTGAIIAMASFPTFDPRSYGEYTADLYKNPFITDTYEPGSTFKPLVMAAAVDAGLVKPDTECSICSGPLEIGGYQIRTWNNEYKANETMTDVIIHSDNTGMVFVAQKLGLKNMVSYMQKYGIGEMTGIDLQGEVALGIRDPDSWYPIDLATAGFGQGISITPIELLTAFSAIANEGKRMEPHIVKQIETPDGEVITIPPKVLSNPISEKSAKIITEMMVKAVDKGEAKFAKPKGYRIAGKTGTAQIPIAGHYDPDQTIASFIGFAPADTPKFLMMVIIDRPTSSIYGAETAAPTFFSIAKLLLAYYNIAPTQ